ncbi:hypothetical protein J6590_101809 [Homalodisca vitripennis]|nr:hypothetical protein J6590_101809 [Homalodisca vitripennis]
MAKRNSNPNCTSCKSKVYKNSKAVCYNGTCKSWFHIRCVSISDEEYQEYLDIGNNGSCLCVDCRLPAAKYMERSRKLKDGNEEVCSGCYPHMKTLIDEIHQLSLNQKALCERLSLVESENVRLRSALENQAEALSDLIDGNSVSSTTYASKVKVGKDVMLEQHNKNNHLIKSTITEDKPSNCLPIAGRPNLSSVIGLATNESTDSLPGQQCTLQTVKIAVNGKGEETSRRSDFRVPSRPGGNVEDFQSYKSKRTSRREKKGSTSNRSGLTGSSSASVDVEHNLTTVSKREYLFISRLTPTTTKDEVKNFIAHRECNDVLVERLNSKHPEEYSSFKVSISVDKWGTVYKSEFWPTGVYINRFFFKKSLNTQTWKANTVT